MIGSKINTHIESAEDSQVKKFHIPKSAIIWNEGKPWIYVESSNNSFLRYHIFKFEEVGHRAGMPEWSKGPDSSKICFLTKIQDFW